MSVDTEPDPQLVNRLARLVGHIILRQPELTPREIAILLAKEKCDYGIEMYPLAKWHPEGWGV